MQLSEFSSAVFQEKSIPAGARLIGWAALAQALAVVCPLRHPSCAASGHVKGSHRMHQQWRIFDARYWPENTFAGHLSFALRHEDLDILVLKRILAAVDVSVVEAFIRSAPAGVPNRIVWFFYEWLLQTTLDIPDASPMTAVPVLDPARYFTGQAHISSRHRVRENLLGTHQFCPVIRRTPALVALLDLDLAAQAGKIVGRARAELAARAASFLLLADSQASFQIEGERPLRGRLERWGRAVMQAGRNRLSLDELIRLQSILIEDTRFVHIGLRPDGVFLGDRGVHGEPLPEFIGARPVDLPALIDGWIEANDRMRAGQLDPVLHAAATAFGFVYIHPFQDGNGRLHRCLIHHVLAERKFTPPGLVFPVSSVMLDQIELYRQTLRAHTAPLMDSIEWRATPSLNVEASNDTADLYRYFDCTEVAEFLYGCVRRAVELDLPREIDYLRRHDTAVKQIMDLVEMPDNMAARIILFIRNNRGKLGKKRREGEWKQLTATEVNAIEEIVTTAFDGFADR